MLFRSSLEKNDKWYGYTDGKHTYVDPADGQTYDMYQTTNITCEEVAEASTRKMMFLKGELATYGLQADDFATYRQSEYNHVVPFETIFFLSKIVSYGDCTLPVIPSLALPLIGMLRMVPPVEHLKAALLRHFSLRAPPAMV